MVQPIDIPDPPHLHVRVIPGGLFHLRLMGPLPFDPYRTKLSSQPMLGLVWQHRPTYALLDVSQLTTLAPPFVEFATGWWAQQILSGGCARLALVAPPAMVAQFGEQARAMARQGSPGTLFGLFDQADAAARWLFTPAPAAGAAPPSSAQPVGGAGWGPPAGGQPAAPPAGWGAAPAGPPPAPAPGAVPVPINVSRPGGLPPLLPFLRPASWGGADVAIGRPLQEQKAADVPFVSLVMEMGTDWRFTALSESYTAPGDTDRLMKEAVDNLERLPLHFEPRLNQGSEAPKMFRCLADFAAEAILSPRFMIDLQKKLSAPALAVAIPARGTLVATSAAPDNGAVLIGVDGMAKQLFADGGPKALTPHLWLVQEGKVLGRISLQTDEKKAPAAASAAGPASAAPGKPREIQALPARSVSEAHLFMDMRGVSRKRDRKLVPAGNDLLTIYTAAVEGESEPGIFAFLIEDPGGQLGAGGMPAPSKIIGPDQFITWADILSKKAPGSPAGLSPDQRAGAKSILVEAAQCLEEIIKFIPPNASSVPEAAFKSEAAKRKFAQEPGRFQQMRLQVVAQTYRKIAEGM